MHHRLAAVLLIVAASASAQEISLRPIASNLDKPVAVAHANDNRLFIATQRGEVFVYENHALREEPLLDIRNEVLCCGERGLLGIVFHPRNPDIFFVSYVDLGGATKLVRVGPNDARRVILTIPHDEATVHFGGHLAFGPDGYLYMSTGDGGDVTYVEASRVDSLLGKILRIAVDDETYAIPPTNPFAGQRDALPEIWAYGLRNPWRFSFDRETGDLWIGDVGQDLREEIDLQPASSNGGENYGWYGMEGTYCHEDSGICGNAQYVTVAPILEYAHDDGRCSVTGGYRYRGARFPEFRGTYFYADFCTGTIFGAQPSSDGRWISRTLAETSFLICSFGEDADGELYVVDYHGAVYAVEKELADEGYHVRRRVRR